MSGLERGSVRFAPVGFRPAPAADLPLPLTRGTVYTVTPDGVSAVPVRDNVVALTTFADFHRAALRLPWGVQQDVRRLWRAGRMAEAIALTEAGSGVADG